MKTSFTEGDSHRWEAGEQSCRFPTGVTFKWGVIPNAQALQDYLHVGYVFDLGAMQCETISSLTVAVL